eukprot:TRINITY_DN6119_c0_g1_i1.p1 TRINITY_DN6119_c0_g1~~TRINITY_DN6119_c0_g1_i1.p1  ORF type:complete len:776 (-),score=183.55 TRINITY_DN6119_c0_g1_i1:243-2570(-)
MFARSRLQFLLLVSFCAFSFASYLPCSVSTSAHEVALQNGFVLAKFDLDHPQLFHLSAAFLGDVKFGGNVFANHQTDALHRKGIVLESDRWNGLIFESFASSMKSNPAMKISVLTNTSTEVKVQIANILDNPANPSVSSTWTLSLNQASRALIFTTITKPIIKSNKIVDVRISYFMASHSIYAQFNKGVEQKMNSLELLFGTHEPLYRVYGLGGGVAFDFFPLNEQSTITHRVLMNSAVLEPFRSGIQEVLVGRYPTTNEWDNKGWVAAKTQTLTGSEEWKTAMSLTPNQYDFPAGLVVLPDEIDMPLEHIRAMYTGAFGSPAGSLVSYSFPSQISPTIAHPGHSYSNLFNFFDPDSFLSISALAYMGDSYLMNECRKLLERNMDSALPTGQLPHHFIGVDPTYVAISGATQTGPNIFWLDAALQYLRLSGDIEWLKTHYARISLILDFLSGFYDPNFSMINAPGPLWIDVFIRNNFTSDTNAYMVHLYEEYAELEEFMNDQSRAQKHRWLAGNISLAINEKLWVNDHYVTQMNMDKSLRDFVDYDSNLIAAAFGISNLERTKALVARIDKGPCTHARATYVSEIFYDAKNCYLGNTGDSTVTMGRIGWVDALTRKRIGDMKTFTDVLLNPLIRDMEKTPFLYERYDCAGKPTHNNYYIEYPELIVMMLREVTYGINISFSTLQITPAVKKFHYNIGNVDVTYDAAGSFRIRVPGFADREKTYIVSGLPSRRSFAIKAVRDSGSQITKTATSDENGKLVFTAPSASDWTISASIV